MFLSSAWIRPARVVVCFVSILFAISCGKPLPVKSHAPLTPEEAQENLAARLKKSNELHGQLTQVREALRSVSNGVSSFTKLLNMTLDEEHQVNLLTGVERLADLLAAATRGTVQRQVDGSWYLDTRVISGLSPEDLLTCPNAQIRLSGNRIIDQEDVVVYLSDCEGKNFDRLAKWIVHTDGLIETTYWPKVLANLRMGRQAVPSAELRAQACRLSTKGGELNVSCDPMTIPLQMRSLMLRHFELHKPVSGALYGSIVGDLRDANHQRLLLIELQALSGRSPRVQACNKSEGKCVDFGGQLL